MKEQRKKMPRAPPTPEPRLPRWRRRHAYHGNTPDLPAFLMRLAIISSARDGALPFAGSAAEVAATRIENDCLRPAFTIYATHH